MIKIVRKMVVILQFEIADVSVTYTCSNECPCDDSGNGGGSRGGSCNDRAGECDDDDGNDDTASDQCGLYFVFSAVAHGRHFLQTVTHEQ